MAKLTVFYLKNCPYCRKARQAAAELLAEAPERYRAVELDWIEESENAALADRYDYYRVPSIFMGGEKLYECSPTHDRAEIKAHFKAAFERAI